MDQQARCGIEGRGSINFTPSQGRDASCSIDGISDAFFDGYIGLPGSLTITGMLFGLDANQPFTSASIGYATDPVGAFFAEGSLLGSISLSAVSIALEFDTGKASTGGASDANDVTYDNPNYSTVQAALDALLYQFPLITTFINNVNTVETGVTITSVTLSWTYNKAMTSASLNQGIGAIPPTDLMHVVSGSFTVDKTWTLTASDGANSTSRNSTIAFRQKRYWGVNAATSLDTAAILALGNSEFATNFNKAAIYDATGGKYPYFAYPATFGIPSQVTVGGLAFSDFNVATQSFTNSSGFTENYHVIRFNNIQSGANISVVWQ